MQGYVYGSEAVSLCISVGLGACVWAEEFGPCWSLSESECFVFMFLCPSFFISFFCDCISG